MIKMTDEERDKILWDIEPTDDQMKAIRGLERAFKKCLKLNIYIWHYYTQLGALNGNVVSDLFVPSGEDIDEYDILVNSVGHNIKHTVMASNSDDNMGLVLSDKYKSKHIAKAFQETNTRFDTLG